MAVDANVLIFERIREEIRAGKSPFNAVEAGYKRAFTTIVDAQRHDLHRGDHPVRVRVRPGKGLRGHARHRNPELDVHRNRVDPSAGFIVVAPHAADRARTVGGGRGDVSSKIGAGEHEGPVYQAPCHSIHLLRLAGGRFDRDVFRARGEPRHRFRGRYPDRDRNRPAGGCFRDAQVDVQTWSRRGRAAGIRLADGSPDPHRTADRRREGAACGCRRR